MGAITKLPNGILTLQIQTSAPEQNIFRSTKPETELQISKTKRNLSATCPDLNPGFNLAMPLICQSGHDINLAND